MFLTLLDSPALSNHTGLTNRILNLGFRLTDGRRQLSFTIVWGIREWAPNPPNGGGLMRLSGTKKVRSFLSASSVSIFAWIGEASGPSKSPKVCTFLLDRRQTAGRDHSLSKFGTMQPGTISIDAMNVNRQAVSMDSPSLRFWLMW